MKRSSVADCAAFPPTVQPDCGTLRSPGSLLKMAKNSCTPRDLVARLDARHDELIAKLDELNAQIEAALAEFSKARLQVVEDDTVREAA